MDRDTILEQLKELGDAEWDVVKSAIKDATNRFAPTVLEEAKVAVKDASTLILPGTAKKEIAFQQITSNLISRGIEVGITVGVAMIYRMIEVAYEWFMEVVVGIKTGAPATGGPIGTE